MKDPKGSGSMTDTQTSNSRSTRRALLASILALLLCFSTLAGTTFAWFTDSVSTGVNKIQAGNLDVDLQYSTDGTSWSTAANEKALFIQNGSTNLVDLSNVLWEPGATFKTAELKVANLGNLALKYNLEVHVDNAYLADMKTELSSEDLNQVFTFMVGDLTLDQFNESMTNVVLNRGESSDSFVVSIMMNNVGNEYQGMAVGAVWISVAATQATVESDSIDNLYDQNAVYPEIAAPLETNLSVTIKSQTASTLTDPLSGTTISIPQGAIANNGDGTEAELDATLTVTTDSTSGDSIDMNISVVDKDGKSIKLEKPVDITVPLKTGLSNVTVYHNGELMDANAVSYNASTGNLTITTDSFSPFTATYDYNPTASVNGQGYSSVADAIKYADEDEVVAIQDDIVTSSMLFNILDGKSHVIDLAGHTIKYTGLGNRAVQVGYEGSSLTIKNGTIDTGAASYGVMALIGGSVTLENVTVNAVNTAGVTANNKGSISLKNVTVNAVDNNAVNAWFGSSAEIVDSVLNVSTSGDDVYVCGVYAYNSSKYPESKVTINGSSVDSDFIGVWSYGPNNKITIKQGTMINSNDFGVYHNGSYAPFVLNMTDSTVVDNANPGAGIYVSNSAGRDLQTVNITRCAISGATAVEVKHTNLTIADSVLTATVNPPASAGNNNGTVGNGYALAVSTNAKSTSEDLATGTVTVDANTVLKNSAGNTTYSAANADDIQGYVFVYVLSEGASVTVGGADVPQADSFVEVSNE
jgi:predicted ribosomally synthesized peptide with SipW-like signal peptide